MTSSRLDHGADHVGAEFQVLVRRDRRGSASWVQRVLPVARPTVPSDPQLGHADERRQLGPVRLPFDHRHHPRTSGHHHPRTVDAETGGAFEAIFKANPQGWGNEASSDDRLLAVERDIPIDLLKYLGQHPRAHSPSAPEPRLRPQSRAESASARRYCLEVRIAAAKVRVTIDRQMGRWADGQMGMDTPTWIVRLAETGNEPVSRASRATR